MPATVGVGWWRGLVCTRHRQGGPAKAWLRSQGHRIREWSSDRAKPAAFPQVRETAVAGVARSYCGAGPWQWINGDPGDGGR
jgi:hypothetical protein